MHYIKKNLLLLLLTSPFTALGAPHYTEPVIKEHALSSYIIDRLDYWFYPNHTDPLLAALARNIHEEIIHSGNFEYQWNYYFLVYEVIYSLDYVEQIIRSAIIEQVSQNSYHYARQITSSENARRIADYIYQYLFNYCSQTAILPQGVFAGCVSINLKNWVAQIYNQATQSYKPF